MTSSVKRFSTVTILLGMISMQSGCDVKKTNANIVASHSMTVHCGSPPKKEDLVWGLDSPMILSVNLTFTDGTKYPVMFWAGGDPENGGGNLHNLHYGPKNTVASGLLNYGNHTLPFCSFYIVFDEGSRFAYLNHVKRNLADGRLFLFRFDEDGGLDMKQLDRDTVTLVGMMKDNKKLGNYARNDAEFVKFFNTKSSRNTPCD